MSTSTRTVWGDIVANTRSHLQGIEWSMNNTLSMVRRRWSVMAASVALCVMFAVLLLMVMKPVFTGVTMLQINTRTEQVTNLNNVVSGLSGEDAAIRTEVDVLSSRKLARKVIERLGMLDEDTSAENPGIVGQVKQMFAMLFMPIKTEEAKKEEYEARMSRAVDGLQNNLEVVMMPRSYSILVRYKAHDPESAAKVANSIAQEYLNNQLEDKFEAIRRANEWMNGRLSDMQKSVQASGLAVEKFREAHGLTAANGVLLSDQQLSELNSQLILARTELAEAQAKYGQTRKMQASGHGIESAAEVLNNTLIGSLREQETTVRREMAELSSKYGERHPRMVTVRNQLGDLRRKISEEINKIQGSLENNVGVAQARVNTLQAQLDAMTAKTSTTSDASVQLAELTRQADAEKSLYENFLNRSKELAQMNFVQSDARVISPAEVPLTPSAPRKKLIILMAVMMGLAIGFGLMLLLEMLDAGFRTSAQVEDELDTPLLGLLGELDEDGVDTGRFVLERPNAAFTEGVRAVRTSMKFINPDSSDQVVVVSSSVPEEGKSLFALSMAQLAAVGGSRVLLIDGDLRRPSLARQLKLSPKTGLADVLNGTAKYTDAIIKMPATGLHVLPSLPNIKFSQELLSTPKMAELIAGWRKLYDVIVIDSPPVMAVSDAVTLASMSDSMLFMVRWGSTPRALAANAIKMLKACHAPLAGCVLTRVDLDKQTTYTHGEYGYYHGKYKGYYSE